MFFQNHPDVRARLGQFRAVEEKNDHLGKCAGKLCRLVEGSGPLRYGGFFESLSRAKGLGYISNMEKTKAKKPYCKPKLKVYGDLRKLTQAKGGSRPDGAHAPKSRISNK